MDSKINKIEHLLLNIVRRNQGGFVGDWNDTKQALDLTSKAKEEIVEQQKQMAIMRDILREVQFAFKKGNGINKDNALALVDVFLKDHKNIAWDYVLREEMEARIKGVRNAFEVFKKEMIEKFEKLQKEASTEIDT